MLASIPSCGVLRPALRIISRRMCPLVVWLPVLKGKSGSGKWLPKRLLPKRSSPSRPRAVMPTAKVQSIRAVTIAPDD